MKSQNLFEFFKMDIYIYIYIILFKIIKNHPLTQKEKAELPKVRDKRSIDYADIKE